jgi:predicted nucleic acid-binding protein
MNEAGSVVVDTSALYAIISEKDRYHRLARQMYQEFLQTRRPLWVTSYVLVEFGAVVQRRLGFAPLSAFYRATGDTLSTLWMDRGRHQAAWAELEERQGKGLSLVDWSVVMAARELNGRIFAFDGGFAREGIAVLPEVRG